MSKLTFKLSPAYFLLISKFTVSKASAKIENCRMSILVIASTAYTANTGSESKHYLFLCAVRLAFSGCHTTVPFERGRVTLHKGLTRFPSDKMAPHPEEKKIPGA